MINKGVHHDGSKLFIDNQSPQPGDNVVARLRTDLIRTELSHRPDQVFFRTVTDGEPVFTEAQIICETETALWWEVTVQMHNPVMHYRWLVTGGVFGYAWLNAAGLYDHDVPDSNDFAVSSWRGGPDWALQNPVYQIFPDRFARNSKSDQIAPLTSGSLPEWAIPRSWSDHPEGRGKNTPFEYFGGDLHGVSENLDHIDSLGCAVLYSTPIFPAGSLHRYDAWSFDEVDPLLGGDSAIDSLVEKLHERGMYFIGDITLNHSGRNHQWFLSAQRADSLEREFYYFDESVENGYESWCGVPSLPKFNFESDRLKEELITSENSPIRKWLAREHGWDGWRVDVANMSGRLREVDLTHEVARLTRSAMETESEDFVLLAEHGHDASGDLHGDGWHGTMNYAGFTRPVWAWLRSPDFHEQFMGVPTEVPMFTGQQAVDTIRAFHGQIPWKALINSWNILSSHDSARIRSVVGSGERQEAAIALAVGLPGIPMVFAQDEIGAEGLWGEDSRTPFPWHNRQLWDHHTLQTYTQLLTLRRGSTTLATGGLRWFAVENDWIAFTRDSPEESFLFVISREAVGEVSLDLFKHGYGLLSPESVFGFTGHSHGDQLIVNITRAGAGVWRMKGDSPWPN